MLCWLLLSRTSESRARVAPGGSHLHLGPRFPRRADVAKQANSGIGVIFWNSPNTREFVEKYDPRASVKMSRDPYPVSELSHGSKIKDDCDGTGQKTPGEAAETHTTLLR